MNHAVTLGSKRRSEVGLGGRAVLLGVLAAFGIVFGVNFYMAYVAVSTFPGEIADHPYEVGLAYNSEISAAAAQDARAWKVDLALSRKSGDETIRATLRDAKGEPLTGLTVAATFRAPADALRDRSIAFKEDEPGVYVGEGAVSAGVWDLAFVASRTGETLFRSASRVRLD